MPKRSRVEEDIARAMAVADGHKPYAMVVYCAGPPMQVGGMSVMYPVTPIEIWRLYLRPAGIAAGAIDHLITFDPE